MSDQAAFFVLLVGVNVPAELGARHEATALRTADARGRDRLEEVHEEDGLRLHDVGRALDERYRKGLAVLHLHHGLAVEDAMLLEQRRLYELAGKKADCRRRLEFGPLFWLNFRQRGQTPYKWI